MTSASGAPVVFVCAGLKEREVQSEWEGPNIEKQVR